MPYKKVYLITLLLFILFFQSVQAQENDNLKNSNAALLMKHQIGINFTSFVDRFLKFNNVSNTVFDPYLFSYRLQFSKASVIRLGIGGSMTNQETTVSTSGKPRKVNSSAVIIRAGYEYYVLNTFKWKAGLGVDIFYHNFNSKSINQDNPQGIEFISTHKGSITGLGPAISLQYFLSKRISLGTECGINYSQTKSTNITEVIDPSFAEFSKSETKSNDIILQTPISLFVNFNF